MTDTEASHPPGWTTVALGQISGEPDQYVPPADESFCYIDIGTIDRAVKVIRNPQRILGKDAPSRARKKVAAGDTLVSMTRPNLNAVALVPKALDGQIASTGFDVLRPAPGVDPRWLAYLVRTDDFVRSMSELVQGALYPAVRSKDVRGFVAPLAPASEQIRIADQLDTLLARVQACQNRLEAIPALLKRFRQAVLSAATSGELIDKGVTAPPLVELRSALVEPLRNGKSVRDGDGLPVLRLTCLKQTGIDLTETKNGDWTGVRDTRRFLIQDDDYLVSRGNGSKELVGRGGLVAGCTRDIAFPDTMIRIRPDKKQLLPDYLKYVWGAPAVRTQIEQSAKTTAGIWKVSQPDLERVVLPLPSIEDQAEIVRVVDGLLRLANRIEARFAAAVKQTKRLEPLTLSKAFRGDLVPQDPNDEPANALLARIAAERGAPVSVSRSRLSRVGRPPRAPKEPAAMTKSRQDDDVMGHPYLAGHLRSIGTPASAEALFKVAELPVADFYKQLAWEVAQGHVKDNQTTLEPGHAAG